MFKKILVILGHPDKDSFNGELARSYAKGAVSVGHEVKMLELGEIKFDPILHKGYKTIQPLEDDLLKAQEDIKWADHLVVVFPDWWGSFPAILKGFVDRIFLPGFAYKYTGIGLWKKLLKPKTARIITTMDGPSFFYVFILFSAGIRIIKKGVLEFSGVSPVKTNIFSNLKKSPTKRIQNILQKVEKLGKKGI